MKALKFNLFGSEWTIIRQKTVRAVDDSHDIYGLTDPNTRTIYVATELEGVKIPKSELLISLYHELIHAILISGQYHAYSDDEPGVEWLARSLHSLKNLNII